MRPATRMLILLACLWWGTWLAMAPTVLAHARVSASFPSDGQVLHAAPVEIHLWFSEPVQPAGQTLLVIGPDGKRVGLGPLHADGIEVWASPRLRTEGTYLVI